MCRARWTFAVAVTVALAGAAWALPAVQTFETEIVALNLQGTGPMPFGPDFAPVQTRLQLGVDPVRPSAGRVTFFPPTPNTPDWTVDSFFDVFFDITVTDVDPQADFRGMSDGASVRVLLPTSGRIGFTTPDPGPPDIYIPSPGPPDAYAFPPAPGTVYGLLWPPNPCDLADFGLFGLLGFDTMNFTVGDLLAADFVPGGIQYSLALSAELSGSVNPPFGPIILTGPTSGEPGLILNLGVIPEPATIALLGLGLAAAAWRRRARG